MLLWWYIHVFLPNKNKISELYELVKSYQLHRHSISFPKYNNKLFYEYTVKDSFSFCKEILDQDPNLVMVSFDIQSSLTNIPLDETINICVDLVFHKNMRVKAMLKWNFEKLLTCSVKSSRFLFSDYKQVDGVAMGSQLVPTLANLLLVYYKYKWLENCPLQFRPMYYHRYFDDSFFIFESRDHVKKFLKYINSRHHHIQFTCEEESNNKISFLDISMTRSLYRKKTFSGVYLNFNSFLPIDPKKGLIHTLLFRAYNICAD